MEEAGTLEAKAVAAKGRWGLQAERTSQTGKQDRQAPQGLTLCQPPLPPPGSHISTLTSHPGGKSAGQEPSTGGEAWAPSMERPRGHIPELQAAQLQGHALADLAGVALHVVIPELAGRKDKA